MKKCVFQIIFFVLLVIASGFTVYFSVIAPSEGTEALALLAILPISIISCAASLIFAIVSISLGAKTILVEYGKIKVIACVLLILSIVLLIANAIAFLNTAGIIKIF